MLPFGVTSTVPMQSHFDGGLGASLYVSPPDAERAEEIIFDRFRPISGPFVAINPNFEPGEYLLSDAGVATVKAPENELAWDIPSEYLGATAYLQVRPHEGGLELDTTYRPQRVTIDSDGVVTTVIAGVAVILRAVVLDAGGIRIDWEWYPALIGTQPTAFEVAVSAGPTSPDPVTVPIDPHARLFVATFSGLQHGGEYTFEVRAVAGQVSALVARVTATADSTGPDVTMTVEAIEEGGVL